MHHALQIEEILLNIFEFCQPHIFRGNPHHENSLIALATTCRTFKEPALDMIWAEMEDDLTPLVRCLPKEMWVVNKQELGATSALGYSLKKPLGRVEWDIILGYSCRIQVLPSLSGSLGLTTDAIEALSNPPISGSIFPKLRIVALHEPSAAVGPLVRHLAHSRITNILLRDAEALGATIDAFGPECPFVTDFNASQWTNIDVLSSLICHWRNLRSVHSRNSLNLCALSHLSRLHKLVDMSFETNETVVNQIHTAQSLTVTFTFPALRELYLCSTALTPIWQLVRHFRLPVIHDLSIGIRARPTVTDLVSFFMSVRESCAHDLLRDITLRVLHVDDAFIQTSPIFDLTFDRLCPLTVFSNIRSITLDIPCGMDLNAREFLTLASWWPRLEVFKVARNSDWTPSSALTPEGFLQLLERCRLLRVLFFTLDTHGYTEIPQGHPWRGLRMPVDTFIHLLNSPIEEDSVEALGVFFHVAPHPDFSLTTHWKNSYYEGGERPRELCNLYYDRWVRARDLARVLWEERRDLRQSLMQHSSQSQDKRSTIGQGVY